MHPFGFHWNTLFDNGHVLQLIYSLYDFILDARYTFHINGGTVDIDLH